MNKTKRECIEVTQCIFLTIKCKNKSNLVLCENCKYDKLNPIKSKSHSDSLHLSACGQKKGEDKPERTRTENTQ